MSTMTEMETLLALAKSLEKQNAEFIAELEGKNEKLEKDVQFCTKCVARSTEWAEEAHREKEQADFDLEEMRKKHSRCPDNHQKIVQTHHEVCAMGDCFSEIFKKVTDSDEKTAGQFQSMGDEIADLKRLLQNLLCTAQYRS